MTHTLMSELLGFGHKQ